MNALRTEIIKIPNGRKPVFYADIIVEQRFKPGDKIVAATKDFPTKEFLAKAGEIVLWSTINGTVFGASQYNEDEKAYRSVAYQRDAFDAVALFNKRDLEERPDRELKTYYVGVLLKEKRAKAYHGDFGADRDPLSRFVPILSELFGSPPFFTEAAQKASKLWSLLLNPTIER